MVCISIGVLNCHFIDKNHHSFRRQCLLLSVANLEMKITFHLLFREATWTFFNARGGDSCADGKLVLMSEGG